MAQHAAESVMTIIVEKTRTQDERWYYILECAKDKWSVEELRLHLRADDYHHIGALPNNFAKTLSPMSLATKAAAEQGKNVYIEGIFPDILNKIVLDAYATNDKAFDALLNNAEKYKAFLMTLAGIGYDQFRVADRVPKGGVLPPLGYASADETFQLDAASDNGAPAYGKSGKKRHGK